MKIRRSVRAELGLISAFHSIIGKSQWRVAAILAGLYGSIFLGLFVYICWRLAISPSTLF